MHAPRLNLFRCENSEGNQRHITGGCLIQCLLYMLSPRSANHVPIANNDTKIFRSHIAILNVKRSEKRQMSSVPEITCTRRTIRREASCQLTYFNACEGQDRIQKALKNRLIEYGGAHIDSGAKQLRLHGGQQSPRNLGACKSHLTRKFDMAVHLNEVYDECE